MSLLSPAFLQKLGRTRLGVRYVTPSTGIGERRSRSIGSGIEFTDHRSYQFGDDTRKIDPHILARLGKHYVRQYSVSQALQVTVMLDSSRSMHYGEPGKFAFGRSLAAAFAYAGLSGGDQVLVGAFSRGRVDWHHRLQGVERTAPLMAWLSGLKADGPTDLHRAIRTAIPRIGKVPGLIAVVVYAIPPIIRLTNLGIRLVDKDVLEAADAFGSSGWQRLKNVQMPLALPTIMAGINQTIMMALAMVVIASMIGVQGLGQPVLKAIANQYFTLGVFNGLAIVGIAIIFDRVSQAYGKRLQKHLEIVHG